MRNLDTQFASVAADRIAYQVTGSQGPAIVFTNGQWGNVDLDWDDPRYSRFVTKLASIGRVIRFNMRGTGLSDARPADGRTIEAIWEEDLRAVLDAVRVASVCIFGWIDTALLAVPFAVRNPELVSSLILFNTTARFMEAPDYPIGHSKEFAERLIRFTRDNWGTNKGTRALMPSIGDNEAALSALSRVYRSMASPKMVVMGTESYLQTDVRSLLPEIRVPTLVMTRQDYSFAPTAHGEYLARNIPGAKFLDVPGCDYGPWSQNSGLVLKHVEEFLTGSSQTAQIDRRALAVLFTDIVGSTQTAVRVGDAEWRGLLDKFEAVQNEQVALHQGRVVDFTGDGALCVFDRSDHAIECAFGIIEVCGRVGIRVRSGVHFGDVEMRDGSKVGGLSVHIGARVAALAGESEVLISRTVRDIHLGTGWTFQDRGPFDLKGVPGTWELFQVIQ